MKNKANKISRAALIMSLTLLLFNACKKDESTPIHDFWAEMTPFADTNYLARSKAVAFAINGKGYIGTGEEDLGIRNDFWQYDTTNNSWKALKPLTGHARYGAVGFAINGKGYIALGGFYKHTTGEDSLMGDLWEYDPLSENWTQKASFPGTPRMDAVVFVINNKAYVGLGQDSTKLCNDFYAYDPLNNLWTSAQSLPAEARTQAIALTANGQAYVGCGRGEGYTAFQDMWAYNPQNESWTRIGDFAGGPRVGAIGLGIYTKAYVGMGWYKGKLYDDFWEYDPATNKWIKRENYGGQARSNAISFVIGNKAYAGVSWDDNDMWVYTP